MATLTLDLDHIWSGSEPASKDTVDDLFDSYLSEVRQQLETVIGKRCDERPKAATDLVAEIQQHLEDIRAQISKARNGAMPDHRRLEEQLQDFADSLRSWCGVIATVSGEAAANTKARFSDFGAWATHYSIVRMTISTFFVGISWGIVSLKWGEYSPDLSRAALLVWSLAGVFLAVFTALQARAVARQRAYASLLPTLEGPRAEGFLRTIWKTIKELRKGFWGLWSPVLIYIGLTFGFFHLLEQWFQARTKTSVTWTAIVSNSSIEKEKRVANANSVDFAPWGHRMDQVSNSLGKIAADLDRIDVSLQKLSSPTPTPKPNTKGPRRPGRRTPRSG
jgi:hypothetical protein